MVKKDGLDGYRSFTVVNATKHDGCLTKFKEGRYISSSPFGAAKKAFTELCRVKNIKGVCTFIITVQETTEGSNKKKFSYKLNRKKLAKPIIRLKGTKNEFLIHYETTGKSVNSPGTCKKQRHKSSGVMSKATKGKHQGNHQGNHKGKSNKRKSKQWNLMNKLMRI